MTKQELREQLQNGKIMEDLFHFISGQECDIYKSNWEVSDEIIYIPDIYLNEIMHSEALEDSEDIENIVNNTYTGKDFMDLTDENENLAKKLFYYCDWQHPSSALDEVKDKEDDEVTDNKQDKIKDLIKSIKEETDLGYKGMEEYTEDLLDTYVCTCHFDKIHDLICELEKELEV